LDISSQRFDSWDESGGCPKMVFPYGEHDYHPSNAIFRQIDLEVVGRKATTLKTMTSKPSSTGFNIPFVWVPNNKQPLQLVVSCKSRPVFLGQGM
jgi:hypothetical protein